MLSSHAAASKDRNTASKSPSMQHRHFATIAAIIRHELPAHMRETAANVFGDALRSTNANFDHSRFIRACTE